MTTPAVTDIHVDVGVEEIVVAAESDGVRVAVAVDGTRRIDERDLPDVLLELGRELGHYTMVAGGVLHKRRRGIAADGGP